MRSREIFGSMEFIYLLHVSRDFFSLSSVNKMSYTNKFYHFKMMKQLKGEIYFSDNMVVFTEKCRGI